jgi:ATP-binding cassette subfamily B protein
MKYFQQHDENDCGPASLAMVASHYNSHINIGQARKLCKTDAMGTNMFGLVTAADKLGFQTKALKGEVKPESLNAKLLYPFIAHVQVQYSGSMVNHFVVVKEINAKYIVVYDPNPAQGIKKVSREEFLRMWTGFILLLSPGDKFRPEKSGGNVLLKFFPLFFSHKKEILIASLASAILIAFGIVTSFYYKYIIDEVIIARAKFSLLALSIGVVLVTIFQSITETGRGFFINHFAYKVNLRLSFSYIAHILKLPISFFETMRTGEIISRLTDVSKIKDALSGTTLTVIMDIALLVIITPILFKINVLLTVIVAIAAVLMGLVVFLFSKAFRKSYTRLRQEESVVNSSLVEMVNGAHTVKALNASQSSFGIYEQNQMKAQWTSWNVANILLGQKFFTGLLNGLCTIVVFWAGAAGIIKDELSIGTLMSFNALSAYFTGPLFRLVNLQPLLQEAFVSASRVFEILEIEQEQDENIKLLKPVSLQGVIEFQNVAFRYGLRSPIYRDISFQIQKGQRVGFVGPSGCGKTTLVKLLLKFYVPESGSVFIDGNDTRDIDAVSLRSRIGYVPQDIYIYSGTIAENIALQYPDAPLEDIICAAKKAGADEFINNLPERYNTRLSERGSTLSGGEKQRIALARALMGNPDIMILDEATSNLDTVSEHLVREIIDNLKGGMTIIIIAHRLTTIQSCDTIFVMEKGKIIESGSHKTLLAKKGLYHSLWEGGTK